uniref:Uncharacterized protein n=1 Tax=Molossus molossus TaxID=27622 RepID=A0A7J8IZ77_MOLMO|nr:hypothetical protein HJG59_010336 [Molossus molossus]
MCLCCPLFHLQSPRSWILSSVSTQSVHLEKCPRRFNKCFPQPQPYFPSSGNHFTKKLVFPLPNVTAQKVIVRNVWFVRGSWVRAFIRGPRSPELCPWRADGQRAGSIIFTASFSGHVPIQMRKNGNGISSAQFCCCRILFIVFV